MTDSLTDKRDIAAMSGDFPRCGRFCFQYPLSQ